MCNIRYFTLLRGILLLQDQVPQSNHQRLHIVINKTNFFDFNPSYFIKYLTLKLDIGSTNETNRLKCFHIV